MKYRGFHRQAIVLVLLMSIPYSKCLAQSASSSNFEQASQINVLAYQAATRIVQRNNAEEISVFWIRLPITTVIISLTPNFTINTSTASGNVTSKKVAGIPFTGAASYVFDNNPQLEERIRTIGDQLQTKIHDYLSSSPAVPASEKVRAVTNLILQALKTDFFDAIRTDQSLIDGETKIKVINEVIITLTSSSKSPHPIKSDGAVVDAWNIVEERCRSSAWSREPRDELRRFVNLLINKVEWKSDDLPNLSHYKSILSDYGLLDEANSVQVLLSSLDTNGRLATSEPPATGSLAINPVNSNTNPNKDVPVNGTPPANSNIDPSKDITNESSSKAFRLWLYIIVGSLVTVYIFAAAVSLILARQQDQLELSTNSRIPVLLKPLIAIPLIGGFIEKSIEDSKIKRPLESILSKPEDEQNPRQTQTWIRKPTGFYSCFISYSSKDQEFAERLHADLQNKGVRCWFAPHDLPIGARIRPAIDESIRLHDKLLLVLSDHSVSSQWVEQEVETALARERGPEGKTVLFPIRIDDAVMESTVSWASLLKNTRNVGDFTHWKYHDSYQKAFDRLLRDLKTEA